MQKQTANDCQRHVHQIPYIVQNWHQNIPKLKCLFTVGKKLVIDFYKITLAFFFVAKRLYDLLPIEHFLHKAFFLCQRFLLCHHETGTCAPYFLSHKEHKYKKYTYCKCQPNAVTKHHDKHSQYRQKRLQKHGHTLPDQLSDGICIIGICTHNIPVGICIKILNRQCLHI